MQPAKSPWILLFSVLSPGFTAAQLQGTRKAFDQVRAGAIDAADSPQYPSDWVTLLAERAKLNSLLGMG